MKYLQVKRLLRLASNPVLWLSGWFSTAAWGEEVQRWQTNMAPGATEVGQKIYDLHMTVFWICVVIGIGVFGFLFYSVFAYRKSKGAEPSNFHENTLVEVLWTVVPFFILIAMAIPATKTLLEIYDTEDADMDILVTGYQWKWKYEYIDPDGENVSFFSSLSTPKAEIYNEDGKNSNYLLEVDEPLVIPAGKKVRFLVTANDVIHSWWVPALAVKKDAIPGFVNEAWTRTSEVGTYRGQCAELCGRDHGFMPIVVNVVEDAEYQEWIGAKKAEAATIKELMSKEFTMDELVARGKDVYNRMCVACHGINGEGGVGRPSANSPVATGELSTHTDVVVNGVPGTAMQAFGGQLNEVDLAAVITFQRNAFSNNMGDQTQPIDIFKFKQGQ